MILFIRVLLTALRVGILGIIYALVYLVTVWDYKGNNGNRFLDYLDNSIMKIIDNFDK